MVFSEDQRFDGLWNALERWKVGGQGTEDRGPGTGWRTWGRQPAEQALGRC
jgi:hypothetical protein